MKISLIGAGKVASRLGSALKTKGLSICEVFSRSTEKATRLARLLDARPLTSLPDIGTDSDLYLIAVPDDAIATVLEILLNIGLEKKLLVHTSGATPCCPLPLCKESHQHLRTGVFYPLQTFSESISADFRQIPVCLDARYEQDAHILETLAHRLGSPAFRMNDEQRAVLHLCAVMVNNFSNHLYFLAAQILQKHQLPFTILLPLIRETVAKLEKLDPIEAQTGPARRNDQKTIERHRQLLTEEPYLYAMYDWFTQSIRNTYHPAC